MPALFKDNFVHDYVHSKFLGKKNAFYLLWKKNFSCVCVCVKLLNTRDLWEQSGKLALSCLYREGGRRNNVCSTLAS